jgi:hypothetical protein
VAPMKAIPASVLEDRSMKASAAGPNEAFVDFSPNETKPALLPLAGRRCTGGLLLRPRGVLLSGLRGLASRPGGTAGRATSPPPFQHGICSQGQGNKPRCGSCWGRRSTSGRCAFVASTPPASISLTPPHPIREAGFGAGRRPWCMRTSPPPVRAARGYGGGGRLWQDPGAFDRRSGAGLHWF